MPTPNSHFAASIRSLKNLKNEQQQQQQAALIASKHHGYDNTNNTADDKGDVDEDEDEDDNDDTNQRRHPQNADSHAGTISTLTTNTNTNTTNNRGTRDNNDDANANADANADNNKNTDAAIMGNSNVVTQQETTQEDFEVGDGGASDGEGSIANTFLMGDDNNTLDNDDADANDDVDVHTRLQDARKDFMAPAAKSSLGKPLPKFNWKKEGKYLHHQLPSGCTPVPGEGTKRKFNNWDFYYTGWIPEDDKPAYSRRHVLPSMKGVAEYEEAQAARSNKREADSWRCPILLSAAAPPSDPVDEEADPSSKRKPFYSKVSRWSSNYANHDHTGKGHYVGRITLKDVVRFDSIVFLHGVLDGMKENIFYRWVHSDALYSHKIKANLNLNCNLKARVQMAECKQDMSTFNYAYKFDYIYEALVYNTWYFKEKAGDDLCMDESSWPYYGFGLVDLGVNKALVGCQHSPGLGYRDINGVTGPC
eukprot:jgi/Psemu1/29447/gm1.29447_g